MSELTRRGVIGAGAALALPFPLLGKRAPIEGRMVVEDGRLWVGAQIGERTLRFIVDTGAAGNFIRPELAKEMGLPYVSGGAMITGVGNRSRVVGSVEARNIVIAGAMRQVRMQFSTYDFGRGLTPDAAGLLAAGLVTAYDSELLLGDTMATWRIWPDGRDAEPVGMPLPGVAILRQSPSAASERIYADATIDGKTYRLLVDTGAPRSLMLYPRATVRSGLWNNAAWAPLRVSGFGGPSARLSRLTRASSLDFGPLKLKRPFVTLTDPAQGDQGGHDGIIGLPLISLFDWSIAPQKSKIWLQRNARRAAAPFYGRSGLWLRRESDGSATVEAVGAGSPAAAAGVAIGTRVPDFESLVPRINGAAGSVAEVGGKQVTLADYL